MYLLIPTALLQTHTAPAHHRRPAPGPKLNNSRAVLLLMSTGHTFTAAAGTAHDLQQHSGTASQINGPQLEPLPAPGIDAAYIVTK